MVTYNRVSKARRKPQTQNITAQLYPGVIRRISAMAARESTTMSALVTHQIEREFARVYCHEDNKSRDLVSTRHGFDFLLVDIEIRVDVLHVIVVFHVFDHAQHLLCLRAGELHIILGNPGDFGRSWRDSRLH